MSATSGEQTRSISIHALREEGDASLPEGLLRRSISIHALREEGDFSKVTYRAIRHHFYPRPPRGGRRRYSPLPQLGQANFYPRPPRGGRLTTSDTGYSMKNFYPRPPRGGRPGRRRWLSMPYNFYPRPPRGGRRVGWFCFTTDRIDFYPRPPRGGRPSGTTIPTNRDSFLSTPSARRATHNVDGAKRHRNISIHALREEGDSCILFEELLDLISIHALREEGDADRITTAFIMA